MAGTKISGLTEGDLDIASDMLEFLDVSDTSMAGTGTNKRAAPSRLLGMFVSACDGRLTTETGVSVSTSDRTAQGTIYLTPHHGNRVALYDGTRWKLYSFTERSLALSSLTSGKNYDVFLYDNAGTLTLELSAAWTNDTTRADALTTQDGVYVKSGATTRRYVGTIRTTSTTTTEDSASKRFVWNAQNRVHKRLSVVDTTDTWSYTTATWRQANGSAANKVEYVCGLNEDAIFARTRVMGYNNSAAYLSAGIGIDSTTANSATVHGMYSSITHQNLIAEYNGWPGIGYHYVAWLEVSDAVGTSQWYGDSGSSFLQSGMVAEITA